MANINSDQVPPASNKDEFLSTRVRVALVEDDDECPICKGVYAEANESGVPHESPVELQGCKHVLGRARLERIINGNAESRNRCPLCRDVLFVLTEEERREAFHQRLAEEDDEEDTNEEDEFDDESGDGDSDASEVENLIAQRTDSQERIIERLRYALEHAGPDFAASLERALGGVVDRTGARRDLPAEVPMSTPSSTAPGAARDEAGIFQEHSSASAAAATGLAPDLPASTLASQLEYLRSAPWPEVRPGTQNLVPHLINPRNGRANDSAESLLTQSSNPNYPNQAPRTTAIYPLHHLTPGHTLPYLYPPGLDLPPRPLGQPPRPVRSLGELTREIAALHRQGRYGTNGDAEQRLAWITERLERLEEDMRRLMR